MHVAHIAASTTHDPSQIRDLCGRVRTWRGRALDDVMLMDEPGAAAGVYLYAST